MIKKKKLKKMGNYGSPDNYNYSDQIKKMNDIICNSKPELIDHVRVWWKSFWYKWTSTGYYDGTPNGHYKFRWQRLQNIVIMLMLVAIYFVLKTMV